MATVVTRSEAVYGDIALRKNLCSINSELERIDLEKRCFLKTINFSRYLGMHFLSCIVNSDLFVVHDWIVKTKRKQFERDLVVEFVEIMFACK